MATDMHIQTGIYSGFAIGFVSEAELAKTMGFPSATATFKGFLKQAGIEHVPGLPGKFDPKHIRIRLDRIQGLPADTAVQPTGTEADKHLEQSRARRGKV